MTGLPPKLCKNCKHFSRIAEKCIRLGQTIDLVSGDPVFKLLDCRIEREEWNNGNCGPSARYWEQAEPHE